MGITHIQYHFNTGPVHGGGEESGGMGVHMVVVKGRDTAHRSAGGVEGEEEGTEGGNETSY